MSSSRATTECPPEDQVAAYVQGQLEAGPRAGVEQHLDGCSDCAQVVADLVRIFSVDGSVSGHSVEATLVDGEPDQEEYEPDFLTPGSLVGRYNTLECVGVGGMGVVYAAYDPELDRKVALKLLLRDTANDEGRRARLVREAQALARVTHPNVITVHDVGTWHEQVFVAMEFVSGGTLKSWMKGKARPWSEVRPVLLAAGRGLAAAHAAGLVHRDFKPDNVLMGDDGRVCVTDFGLARWEEGAVSTGQELASHESFDSTSLSSKAILASPDVSLTRTGTLVGTPAYMAPEQYRQERTGATTDQYAFCVVLYEALYGHRPHRGSTLAELAASVTSSDKIEFPSCAPRHVRQALSRGLSRKPSDRFGSMDELLKALATGAVKRWRWAAVAALPVVAGAGAWTYESTQHEAQCEGPALLDVWNPQRREALADAFADSGVRFVDSVTPRVLEAIDGYAYGWEDAHAKACEASQSGERMGLAALQERCLGERRVAFEVVLDHLAQPDEQTISRAMGTVRALPEVEDCVDEQTLLADVPPPAPAAIAMQVDEVRQQLARVKAYRITGQYDEGLALIRALDSEAEALGHKPLQADVRLYLGDLIDIGGDPERGLAVLQEAELLATASRHHRAAGYSLLLQVYILGAMLGRADEARLTARRARAKLEAAGALGDFESALLLNQATTEFKAGEFVAAEALAVEALGLRDRKKTPLHWADAVYNLAVIRGSMGQHEEAVEALRDYLEVFEAEHGRLHPEVSQGYHSLSVMLDDAGRPDESVQALQTSLDILEKTVGSQHILYATPLSGLAELEADRGNFVKAIEMMQRAMKIRHDLGVEAIPAAGNRLDIAAWTLELGDSKTALEQAELALQEAVAVVGPDHPELIRHHEMHALMLARRGDREGTWASLQEAERIIRKRLSEEDEGRWSTRVVWISLLGALGEPREAVEHGKAVLAEAKEANVDGVIANTQFALAKVLHDDGKPDEARTHAQAARERFAAMGQQGREREVVAWIEAQR